VCVCVCVQKRVRRAIKWKGGNSTSCLSSTCLATQCKPVVAHPWYMDSLSFIQSSSFHILYMSKTPVGMAVIGRGPLIIVGYHPIHVYPKLFTLKCWFTCHIFSHWITFIRCRTICWILMKMLLVFRMWWTITGNFGNILPIDWSKSYARKLHMPALNLNENKVFIVWTSVWLVDGILWNLF